MKVAISQPTYLPWIGYLDLIDQSDRFVFLDTVQFEKRSWQQRNRIKSPQGLMVLTVPVTVKGRFGQKIKDVEIEGPFFVRKHLRSMESNYGRAPYFQKYFGEFSRLLEACDVGTKLADLNIILIEWLCRAVGISTPLLRASSLDSEGARSERLVKICRTWNADCYLSALGSADYLLDDLHDFTDAGLGVEFHHFDHPHYSQLFSPFLSHASAIDLLFNEGEHSLDVIRSGRRAAFRPEEMNNHSPGAITA